MNNLIGNTPLIEIKYKYKDKIRKVYVKLEYYNITGSIKDRMVEYIIDKSYKDGSLKKGMPIIEVTSGNTGISLSSMGARYNHPVYIFMPNWCSNERKLLMEQLGAKVVTVSNEEGGFSECLRRANFLATKLNGFRPNQFSNKYNIEAHYYSTALEIIKSIDNISGFISGIGTGGTLMGVGKRLKQINEHTKIVALEPDTMTLLSGNDKVGSHKIEGIGDDFIPKIVDRNIIDDVILINDNDAINMSRLISKKLGLGVGISSGANLLGSILLEEEIRGNIVTVFADDNKKYLSGDLSKDIDLNDNFISNKIELLSFTEI